MIEAMETDTAATAPAFLCDEMLLGLGRWLRAAGYDAALSEPGADDRCLIEQAIVQHRLLATRDRHMRSMRGADGIVILLRGNDLDTCAGELAARPAVDWLYDPFSRCLQCNRRLEPGNSGYPVAAWVAMQHAPTWHCPGCRKAFWHGSHVERMLSRLQAWSRAAQDAGDDDC